MVSDGESRREQPLAEHWFRLLGLDSHLGLLTRKVTKDGEPVEINGETIDVTYGEFIEHELPFRCGTQAQQIQAGLEWAHRQFGEGHQTTIEAEEAARAGVRVWVDLPEPMTKPN